LMASIRSGGRYGVMFVFVSFNQGNPNFPFIGFERVGFRLKDCFKPLERYL
jgi:hypothetical protein